MRATSRLVVAGVAVVGLVAASCGDDDDATATTTAASATTAAAATTTAAPMGTEAATTTGDETTTTATAAKTTTPSAAATATTAKAAASGEIQVLAATSLTAAFNDLGAAFTTANPKAKANFVFAGSNDLATTVNEGGPADVFASADQNNMKKVTDAANSDGEPTIFATNLLEIMVQPGNPQGIAGLADLANPDLTVITCDPAVPCGTYAQQIFTAAGVTVTPKSLEENVGGVATKMKAGEGDAGIVYATDVLAAGDQAAGVPIPKDINVVAQYPIVVVKQTSNPATAQAFIDFVLSDAGQRILATYGFTGP
jgi:molybdate transport system substrate-binding protein